MWHPRDARFLSLPALFFTAIITSFPALRNLCALPTTVFCASRGGGTGGRQGGGKSRRDIIFRTLRFFASAAHGTRGVIYAPRASAFIKPKYFKTRVKERKARATATLSLFLWRFLSELPPEARRENRQLLLHEKVKREDVSRRRFVSFPSRHELGFTAREMRRYVILDSGKVANLCSLV